MEHRPARAPSSVRQDWWWIFDPRYSLRARVALIVGGGTVLFTVLLSWATGTIFRRALEGQAGAAFETLAFQASDKLDRVIYERYRSLQLGSNLASLRAVDVPAAERRRVLDAMQEAAPDFAWIGLVDTTGRVVAASGGLFEGSDASTRGWFRGAQEHPYAGNLHEMPELAREIPPPADGESPVRFLDLAVPVRSENGRLAGVLAAHVRWDWARAVQLSIVPEATALHEHIGLTVYTASSDVLLDSGVSGWTHPPGPPAIGETRRARGFLSETAAGGTHYLSGYARSRGFRDYHGLGWLTIVRQPVERALAPVAPLQRSIAQWGFVLAILGITASWILAGRHARRLHSIGAAATRIRSGDILTVLPRPRDESELAQMCGALGDLVEDLRTKNETLAARNTHLEAENKKTRGNH